MSEREEPEPSRGIQPQRAEPAALIAEEPSSTPVVPIAPHPGFDFISRSPVFDPAGRVNVIWESSRVDDVNQVFATRWNAAEAETAIPTDTAPRQVTAGSAPHWLPAVVVLPGGDLVVAYETARADIYFKRAPFERLATAAERPVATSQREMEKFPLWSAAAGAWCSSGCRPTGTTPALGGRCGSGPTRRHGLRPRRAGVRPVTSRRPGPSWREVPWSCTPRWTRLGRSGRRSRPTPR